MLNNPADQAMVRAVTTVARQMGLHTVAEFVEDDAMVEKLVDLGVDYSQGFGVGRPVLLQKLMQHTTVTN